MARNCIVVNLDRCTGCFGCEVACKMENGVALGERWSKVFTVGPVGEYPDMTRYALPTMCQQCENAPCVSVCPTGASYRDGNNVVLVDKEKCIGCKYCMAACPYGARYAIVETGVVGKCTYCAHRSENGLLPACVSTCVTKARIFGDLNDPDSDISKAIKGHGGADHLMQDLGQEPTLCYFGLSDIEAMPRVSAVHKGGNVFKPYEGRQ